MIDTHFPLVDLHRHLDGNIRPQTILELGQQHGIELPGHDLDTLIPHISAVTKEPSLVAFLQKLDWGVKVLKDADSVYRVAYENVADLCQDGIDYAELRFSPGYMGHFNQLDNNLVVEAVIAGVEAGIKAFGVQAKLIGILSRSYGTENCQQELDAILSHRQHFVAVDLAGDEIGFPGHQFEQHFNQVHRNDLQVTIHAGEAAGPESIWHALQHLGAQRIGHGVNAAADHKLMEYLATRQIPLESCLTSNIQTTTVAGFKQHPIVDFVDAGMMITLNTDDPGVEFTTLSNEYHIAHQQVGLSQAQLAQIQRNGLQAAFLSDSERQALIVAKQSR
ncbi:adenosine deaminase [Ferrimonas lipolytica]|uniref:adenosine deaminase n=1 Tax=Ferrimonas lipolytica TaxID=2724191 RepID=A0A6H1UCI4_9GAMM|nr:adenosine deaminase [Ferrimonas lipolytica]QIZ76771.1 adenosine deaminase [Ferrimonas lipolytica]